MFFKAFKLSVAVLSRMNAVFTKPSLESTGLYFCINFLALRDSSQENIVIKRIKVSKLKAVFVLCSAIFEKEFKIWLYAAMDS